MELTANQLNKLKIIRVLFLTFLFLTIMLTACKKADVKCSSTEFCAFISSEDYNETGVFIDKYLVKLKTNLIDEEKLIKLRNWLACKDCVENAEILCVSCISTYPPQSELKVSFTVKGQQTVKILDISMDNPLKFRTYHN